MQRILSLALGLLTCLPGCLHVIVDLFSGYTGQTPWTTSPCTVIPVIRLAGSPHIGTTSALDCQIFMGTAVCMSKCAWFEVDAS